MNVRRDPRDERPLLCQKQRTKRPDAVDVVVLCDSPSATIINEEDISRQLLVECHRLQLTSAKSTGGQNPAREIDDDDSTGKKGLQLDRLWFTGSGDFIEDGLRNAHIGVSLCHND